MREKDALKAVAERLAASKVEWLKPLGSPLGRWLVDFDAIKAFTQGKLDELWLAGRVAARPEYELEEKFRFHEVVKEASVWFEFPSDTDPEDEVPYVPELQPFLDNFQLEHGNSARVAFVMMRFADTPLQQQAFQAVRDTCATFGITALRADHRAYSEDLLPNIRTYMHGCGFGIAIFERIQRDDFNPNVSLEVGYMMALGKPVCLLKDRTLDALHTDLVGRLYESFDPQNAAGSIPAVLERWLRDRQIVV